MHCTRREAAAQVAAVALLLLGCCALVVLRFLPRALPRNAGAAGPDLLLLVNAENPLAESFAPGELAELSNGHRMDARALPDLEAMFADMEASGLSPLICSSYRTQEKQAALFANKVERVRAADPGLSEQDAEKEAARWVARPGTSEHQTGLALDIVSLQNQNLDESQEETAEFQWLAEHSWEYGFILRYPEDKSAVTGIGYEPWHFRYVGREAASAIRESGLCLEEWLDTV